MKRARGEGLRKRILVQRARYISTHYRGPDAEAGERRRWTSTAIIFRISSAKMRCLMSFLTKVRMTQAKTI